MTTAPANRTLTRGSREPTASRWSRRALQHGAGGSGLAAGRPSRSAPESRSGTALRGRGQARSAVAVDVNDVRPGAMSLPCTERGARAVAVGLPRRASACGAAEEPVLQYVGRVERYRASNRRQRLREDVAALMSERPI